MSNILVFGADGLLGSHLCALYPNDVIPITRRMCDLLSIEQVAATFKKYKPNIVINCAGAVKGSEDYTVNRVGPDTLMNECDRSGAKLIHISTDCVFAGNIGQYNENSQPSPVDEYGESKLKGEITTHPHLTIRTSFVGWPDPKFHGLLSWFFNTSQPVVDGYMNVWWNGVTADYLAQCLMDSSVLYSWKGLHHLYGQDITKYELLNIIKQVYMFDKDILPVPEPILDRRLRSVYTTTLNGRNFADMVEEMRGQEWKVYRYLSQFR